MSTLRAYLDVVGEESARAALYYVSRYVKQASYFDEYGKDIFEDEARSAPSDETKDLARRMIVALEEREGISASEFTDQQVITILDEITALEDELGPAASDEEMARAERFGEAIQTPPPRT